MTSFNRERFLFWLLAAVLGYQALFFGFGLWRCGTLNAGQVKEACPNIGERFDSFSERTLAAVLGLIAGGAAASTFGNKKSEERPRTSKATPKNPD